MREERERCETRERARGVVVVGTRVVDGMGGPTRAGRCRVILERGGGRGGISLRRSVKSGDQQGMDRRERERGRRCEGHGGRCCSVRLIGDRYPILVSPRGPIIEVAARQRKWGKRERGREQVGDLAIDKREIRPRRPRLYQQVAVVGE